MKKTSIFVLIALLMLSVGILSSFTMFQTMMYQLEDVQGDRQVLQGISFKQPAIIGTVSMETTVKNGEASKTFLRDERALDKLSYVDYISPSLEKAGEAIGEWVRTEEKQDMQTYITYRQPVESVALIYQFFSKQKSVSIDTGLIDYSNEQYTYYHEHTLFNEDVESIEELKPESGYYRALTQEGELANSPTENFNALVTQNDVDYYFLPMTSAYTTGVNHLYKLRLEEGTYEQLTPLPEGRSYETLVLVNDHLIVISQKDGTLFYDKYDMEGTLLDSWNTTEPLNYQYYSISSNDQYMICRKNEETLFVLDTDKMELEAIESVYIQEEDGKKLHPYFMDFHYKDGVVYSLAMYYSETYVTTGIEIIAMKDGAVLYEGKLDYREKEKINNESMGDVFHQNARFID